MDETHTLKCRLCLVEAEDSVMHELFMEAEISQNVESGSSGAANMALCKRVEYCTGVEIPMMQKLPTKICTKCLNTVDMWNNFREMCLKSQVHLYSEYNLKKSDFENIKRHRANITLDHSNCEGIDDDAHLDNIGGFEDISNASDESVDFEAMFDDNKLRRKFKKMVSSFFVEHNDILGSLTNDDLDVAVPFLIAENDKHLEGYINHCANKNPEIQELKEKAALQLSNTIRRRQRENLKKEELAKKPDKPKKPSQYMCNVCGNVYTKRPTFLYHMRMHSEDRPHKCEICPKAFRIMSDLTKHMYRHTGERPFQCKFCERRFSDRSCRIRHERVHTNTRPYECNICHKTFTYSLVLKNHMKIHNEEKEYACAVCDKLFTLKKNLQAHLLTAIHKQKESNLKLQGYEIVYDAKGLNTYPTVAS